LSAVAHDALAAGSKRWQGFTVKRIFSSSFYAGQRIYGKRTRKPRPLVSGTVPAIVTKERQRQAQLRLAEQRARHARGQPTTTCSRARSAAPHAATPRAAPSTTPSITAPLAGTPAPAAGGQRTRLFLPTTRVSAPTSSNQTLEARQVALESGIERWLDLYPRAVGGQPGSRSTTSTALSLTYAPNSTRSNATSRDSPSGHDGDRALLERTSQAFDRSATDCGLAIAIRLFLLSPTATVDRAPRVASVDVPAWSE
jgi:hypothetical protein